MDEPTAEPRELPPLRIRHLMLWTAVTAVLMAASRQQFAQAVLGEAAVTLVWVLSGAAAMTIVALGCAWRRRGLPFFNEPGHGLALLTLLSVVMGVWLVGIRQGIELGGLSVSWFYFPEVVTSLVAISAAVWMFRRLADTWAWRLLFLLDVLESALAFTHHLVFLSMIEAFFVISFNSPVFVIFLVAVVGVSVVLSLLLLVAMVNDLRGGKRRHWTHTACCVAWLANRVVATYWYLLS